jgi:two-component system, sensor histidine kinase ChiS
MTVKNKIFISSTLVTFVVLLLFSTYLLDEQRSISEKHLVDKANRISQLLEYISRASLWGMDFDGLKNNSESFFQDQSIVSLKITNDENQVVVFLSRQVPDAKTVKRIRPIRWQAKPLGRLEIIFSHHLEQLNFQSIKLQLIIILSVMFVLITVLINFMLYVALKPLSSLMEGVTQLSKNDLSYKVKVESNDELGKLAVAFNQMTANLRENDRMKGEFLANTSRELRSPVNGIIGIASSMLDRLREQDAYAVQDIKNSLSSINVCGKQLANLMNYILNFSKLKYHDAALEMNPVDIYPLVDVVLMLSKTAAKNRQVLLFNRLQPDLPLVQADENRVQQIFYNLLENALKFTEQGEISVDAEVKGKRLFVSIRDTGLGIESKKLQQLREVTDKSSDFSSKEYDGTELGFVVSRKLVQLHGGDIEIESTLGVGSIFTCSFALADTVADKTATAITLTNSTEEDRGETNGFKVLIVDDNPVNLQVLNNYLSAAHYQVTQLLDGQDALDLLAEGEQFDLMLLDVIMPKLTGYDVCKRIRKSYFSATELPILLLTEKIQMRDLAAGFRLGANDYLTKPFEKNELLARMKSHLELSKTSWAYSRFVPTEFLDFLQKDSIIEVGLGDQTQQNMTILFADIRGFTTISESMSLKENFNFINNYLHHIGPIIKTHGGFIDKYMGDGVMALFPENSLTAVLAAIEMQLEVANFNRQYENHYPPIQIGIGVHTGPLMLGTIGEKNRMEGTVISDAVNLASRMEGLTKVYGASIVVSGDVLAHISKEEKIYHRYLGKVRVKGKRVSAVVHEVFADLSEQQLLLIQQTEAFFSEGLDLFYAQKFADACIPFGRVLEKNSTDRAARFYFARSGYYLVNKPDPNSEFVDILE